MKSEKIKALHEAIKSKNLREVESLLSENKIPARSLTVALKDIIADDSQDYVKRITTVGNSEKISPTVSDLIKLLLKNGADINAEHQGETILNRCAHRDDIEMIDYLLEHYQDKLSDEAIEFAFGTATNQEMSVFNRFLAFFKNKQYDFTKTPVFLDALTYTNEEVLDILLSEGFDINCQDTEGRTVLMLMFENLSGGDEVIVDALHYLLKNGFDIMMKDNDGHAAIDYAIEYGKGNPISKVLVQSVVESIELNKTIKTDQGNQTISF